MPALTPAPQVCRTVSLGMGSPCGMVATPLQTHQQPGSAGTLTFVKADEHTSHGNKLAAEVITCVQTLPGATPCVARTAMAAAPARLMRLLLRWMGSTQPRILCMDNQSDCGEVPCTCLLRSLLYMFRNTLCCVASISVTYHSSSNTKASVDTVLHCEVYLPWQCVSDL